MKKAAFLIIAIATFLPASHRALAGYVSVPNGSGNTLTADTCSQSDVAAALAASVDGDTVRVPAGTCTWTSQTVGDKRINFIGAGIDQTVIDDAGGVGVTTTKTFRISGFTFQNHFGGILITKKSGWSNVLVKGWRVDHIKFVVPDGTEGNGAIFVTGPKLYGVIDHCIIDATLETTIYVAIHMYGYKPEGGETIAGDISWSQPPAIGTDNAVFIEDTTITSNATDKVFLNDMYYGGPMVIRHNTLTNALLQTHAGGHGGGRGGGTYEIYDNTFTSTSGMLRPGQLRSATGVIYNNTITGDWLNRQFTIDNVRTSVTNGPFGLCDGVTPYDGNTPGELGWPCLDQIGRDQGGAIQSEPSNPLYTWNNNAGAVGVQVVDVWLGSPFFATTTQVTHLKTTDDASPHTGGVVDYVNNGTTPKPGYVAFQYPYPYDTSYGQSYLSGIFTLLGNFKLF